MNTAPHTASNTILLVEDNVDDIELALYGLEEVNSDCKVHVTKSGEDALDYLFCTGKYSDRIHQGNPQLILLDIGLPGINGLEVLEKIRQSSTCRRIPVVIFSSSDEDSDIAKGYDLGANSYLQKPLRYDTFKQVLEGIGLYWLGMNITAH